MVITRKDLFEGRRSTSSNRGGVTLILQKAGMSHTVKKSVGGGGEGCYTTFKKGKKKIAISTTTGIREKRYVILEIKGALKKGRVGTGDGGGTLT